MFGNKKLENLEVKVSYLEGKIKNIEKRRDEASSIKLEGSEITEYTFANMHLFNVFYYENKGVRIVYDRIKALYEYLGVEFKKKGSDNPMPKQDIVIKKLKKGR